MALTQISSSDTYYEWDLTAYVKEQLEIDKIASLVIEDLEAANANVEFYSREAEGYHPEMVVITNGLGPQSSTDKHPEKQVLSVYPNPAFNVLHVNVSGGSILKCEIYNLFGQVLYTGTDFLSNPEIDIEHLNSAVYLLRVETDGGISTRKFIIQDCKVYL